MTNRGGSSEWECDDSQYTELSGVRVILDNNALQDAYNNIKFHRLTHKILLKTNTDYF